MNKKLWSKIFLAMILSTGVLMTGEIAKQLSLTELPQDMLHEIFFHSSENDYKNLSRVNKQFAADPYLLGERAQRNAIRALKRGEYNLIPSDEEQDYVIKYDRWFQTLFIPHFKDLSFSNIDERIVGSVKIGASIWKPNGFIEKRIYLGERKKGNVLFSEERFDVV